MSITCCNFHLFLFIGFLCDREPDLEFRVPYKSVQRKINRWKTTFKEKKERECPKVPPLRKGGVLIHAETTARAPPLKQNITITSMECPPLVPIVSKR